MKKWNIATVITSFKSRKEILSKVVNSVTASKDVYLERIIVIDYGTQKSVLNHIKECNERVDIIRLREDPGLQYMRALGAFYAMKKYSVDIIVFLDNDLILLKDTLHKLCNALRLPGVGSASPIIVNLNGTPWVTIMTDFSCAPLTDPILIDHKLERGILLSAYNSGACFAVRADALRDIGYCSREMRFWLEDMDIGLRLWRQGYKVVTVLSAIALHLFGTTRRRVHDIKAYYMRNVEEYYFDRLRCIHRNFDATYLLKGMLLLLLDVLRFNVFKPLHGYDKMKRIYALKGLIRGLFRLKNSGRVSTPLIYTSSEIKEIMNKALGIHIRSLLKLVNLDSYSFTAKEVIDRHIQLHNG